MLRAFVSILCLFAFAPRLEACAVPVFRYALERWESDPFQLVVFNAGPLPATLDQRLRDLEPVLTENPGARVNFKVTRVDTTSPVPALWKELWEAEKDHAGPRMVLCTPEWTKGEPALWSGALDDASLETMIDSPKRREIVAHLLKGTAVIWLVVETDDQTKNAALGSLLETESERMVNDIIIPAGIGKDGVDVRSSLPIEVSFATVKVKQDDPAEAILMRLLTNGEKLVEPTLYPVFGRARALASMPAKTVNKDLLDETGRFICGACSCQVKAQNPGFDLLVKANWESIFGDQAAPPPDPKLSPATKPIYVPIPARKKS